MESSGWKRVILKRLGLDKVRGAPCTIKFPAARDGISILLEHCLHRIELIFIKSICRIVVDKFL